MRRRVIVAASTCACAALTTGAFAGGAAGDITFRDCVSGSTGTSGACDLFTATPTGLSSGLNVMEAIAASADGKSVYVVANGDDSIARFKRNTRSGALTPKGCISGNDATGPAGTDTCAQLPAADSNGAASGMDGPTDVAVSKDGTSVYVTAENDDTVASFDRSRSGALQFAGCITGRELPDDPCTEIPDAVSIGSDRGLDSPQSVVVSPDGKSLYVAAQLADAVTRFKRAKGDGSLTYRDCLSSDTEAGPTGTAACEEMADPQSGGSSSGFNAPSDLAISANGKSLYGISGVDSSIARFSRAKSGALTYKACTAGATEVGPAGTDACELMENASAGGTDSGMAELTSIAVSPDDETVYVTSQTDAAVTGFDRAGSGALEFGGCTTGETATGANCNAIATAAGSGGNNSGLAAPNALAFAGSSHLYVSLVSDHGVAHLKRNPNTGALNFRGCITGEDESGPTGSGACDAIESAATAGAGSGLDNGIDLVVGRDRSSLYMAAQDDDAVARFKLVR